MSRKKTKPSKKTQKRKQTQQRRERAVGKEFVTQAMKRDGIQYVHHTPIKMQDAGIVKNASACDPLIAYSAGITVSTGAFEFLRIEARVEQVGKDKELLLAESRAIVREFLDREEALAHAIPRAEVPYGKVSGTDVMIGLMYGVTMRGEGQRKTQKIDVGVREALQSGETISEGMARIGSWLEDKIREERGRLLGEGKEINYGL